MNGGDAFERQSMSLADGGEAAEHNYATSLKCSDVERYAPLGYDHTVTNDTTHLVETMDGKQVAAMSSSGEEFSAGYAVVKTEGHLLVRGSGDAGPTEQGLRVGGVLSGFKDDLSGRNDSADPMLAARSYEELLISASKTPGESHVAVIKVEPNLKQLQLNGNRQDGYMSAPAEHIQREADFDPSNTLAIQQVSLHPGTHVSTLGTSPYTPDAQLQRTEQGTLIVYKEEQVKHELPRDGETSHDGASTSHQTAPPSNDSEASFSYEPTAYATQTGAEYDSANRGDASFSSYERRDPDNDISLPIANIGRVMKSVLPGSAKIAKQAKDIIRECVTEFILFISSEASDICTNERRKTLSAEDILLAMNALGFDHYIEALRSYHTRWRERDHTSMMDS
ncbi:CCAAT-box DNA binding protein subunit B [Babesia caballi]|uniref:CCAAT-box DNA binding protein subunit B n=1 Tax=Babesia caballi TaxID=5871 RepID=A0AAV4LPS9_BABCB|nr:CCAAT-box DNA binding protein subunit B [Babesia caballi]